MGKQDKSRADWSNYWRGRGEDDPGEVFAGVGIETSEELAAVWRGVFAGFGGGVILDLACGAGSALKHADASGGGLHIGADISEHAVLAAQKAVPAIAGLVASADRLPLRDASIDQVVSQFGFEYANRPAASAEIARILKLGGRFTAVTHMAGGAIAAECEDHLATLDQIRDSGSIPAAKAFFSALYRLEADQSPANQAATQAAATAFQGAQSAMLPAIQKGGIAGHLQQGARQLYERRRSYAEADIAGWLHGMEGEIAAYRGRMTGMLGAAISANEARTLIDTIDPSGTGTLTPLSLGGDTAAYILSATKPG
ncbi:MAG: class I SAM-dependent methyltransferase [Pseudomonadota bacterium]